MLIQDCQFIPETTIDANLLYVVAHYLMPPLTIIRPNGAARTVKRMTNLGGWQQENPWSSGLAVLHTDIPSGGELSPFHDPTVEQQVLVAWHIHVDDQDLPYLVVIPTDDPDYTLHGATLRMPANGYWDSRHDIIAIDES